MKIKTLLIASAMFFSFQAAASVSSCESATIDRDNAQRELNRLAQEKPGSQEYYDAEMILHFAQMKVDLRCVTDVIGGE